MAQKHNKEFYENSITKYGISAQGVHWNSKYSQYKRFEIITKSIKNTIKSSTLVDAGCGLAQYYKYLEIHNKIPKKYIGIDCEDNMISICKKRFPLLDFKKQNILEDTLIKADYYICSGALNILTKYEVSKFIEQCFSASCKGFVFNFLKSDSYNNISIDEIVSYVNKLSSSIKIYDDYLENDCTIFISK